jgi:predicted helicase
MTERELYEQRAAQFDQDQKVFHESVKTALQEGKQCDMSPMASLDKRGEELRKDKARLDNNDRLKEQWKKKFLKDNLVTEEQFSRMWDESLRDQAIRAEAESMANSAMHPMYRHF